jgi:hypothetical protein
MAIGAALAAAAVGAASVAFLHDDGPEVRGEPRPAAVAGVPSGWEQIAVLEDDQFNKVVAIRGGVVGIGSLGVSFSPDGRKWVALLRPESSGDPRTTEPPQVSDVAVTPLGLVPVGHAPEPVSGHAVAAVWSSGGGRDWTLISDPALQPATPPIPLGTSPPFRGSITAIAAGGPGLVAVGEVFGGEFFGPTLIRVCCPAMWTSLDGRRWTRVDDDFDAGDAEIFGFVDIVARGADLLAFAHSRSQTNVFASTDGTAWRRVGQVSGVVQSATVHADTFVAVGSTAGASGKSRAAIWTSSDGSRWDHAFSERPARITSYTDVASNGRSVVAVGYRGRYEATTPGVMTASADGEHWRSVQRAAQLLARRHLSGVAPLGAGFVAVGFESSGTGRADDPIRTRTVVFASAEARRHRSAREVRVELPLPEGWSELKNVLLYPDAGGQPRVDMTVATFDVPESRPADCDLPVAALERLGPTDAFISVVDAQAPMAFGPRPRPASFLPAALPLSMQTEEDNVTSTCLVRDANFRFKQTGFTQDGRMVRVLVAIGLDASSATEAEVLTLIERIVVEPRG